MKQALKYSLFIFFILCTKSPQAFCGWKNIAQFNETGVCGFFWDELNGLVGFGSIRGGTTTAQIRRTNDGGKTWTLCNSPPAQGAVTDIFMKDQTVGYASIYETGFQRFYSVWKTTDGGITWFDNSHGNNALTNCVYATSNALIRTVWFNNNIGGVSFDDGISFSSIFSNFNGERSNGIDFSDALDGVVTMGPSFSTISNSAWFTQDGGVTWNEGDDIPESWSVYGLKGTKIFLALPEDFQDNRGQTVFWSQNGGQNWSTRFIFPGSPTFTGHIGGVGNTLYVQIDKDNQINQGLFRSDDLGLTWTSVGGPSNTRDTRFVVAGCRGQVVYAFDDRGGVWKTIDGGDGTLTGGSSNGAVLAFGQDSLYEETRYCQPLTWTIHLMNPGCNPLTIDDITLTPNPYNEFSIGGALNGSILSAASSLDVPITFHSDSNVTRHSLLHIKAHSGTQAIDTTIILTAKHSTAPEPYLVNLKATKVGDTVLVPVFIRITSDSFAIRHFSFHLSYDGDILTPAFDKYETRGTLSAVSTVSIGSSEPNGILVAVDLPKPITQDSDLTKPLFYLRMGVTLSRYMSCPVRMDTFAISNSAPLPLCSIPEAEFIVDPECGDSSISAFMLDGRTPVLFSVHPNPNTGGEMEVIFSLPKENGVTIELIDAMGKIVQNVYQVKQLQSGEHTVRFNTSLGNGSYVLRLRTSDGYISHRDVVIIH